jgi:hypothetical protein
MRFELLLDDGAVVSWVGATGEEAAQRYVDAQACDVAVLGWREVRHGLFVGSPGRGSS